MTETRFVKFPRTHWLPIGEKPYKSERYLTGKEVDNLFSGEVHVSEKLDGANVGISYHDGILVLQKRGSFIGDGEHPQYGAFKKWASSRYHPFSQLPEGTVLFGEWLFARHSIHYTRLPDYFFVFDVWQGGFLPVEERDSLAERLGLYVPPTIYQGIIAIDDIPHLIRQSYYSDELMEGVVVRNSRVRGKYVRPDFIRGQEHWSKYNFEKNQLAK